MTKGEKVQIKENGKYSGQEMNWTEQNTGLKLFKSGTPFFHNSSEKLNIFNEKTTCFFIENKGDGHSYVAFLKKDMQLETFDFDLDGEVRIDLNNQDVEIFYLGNLKIKSQHQEFKYGQCYSIIEHYPDNRIKIEEIIR